jgi:hypothetical protein
MCCHILKNIVRKVLQKVDLAKSVALEMNAEPIFPAKLRLIRKKNNLEIIMRSMKINHQKNHLKSTIFLLLLISLKTIFEELKTFEVSLFSCMIHTS